MRLDDVRAARSAVQPGDQLLLDDGKIALAVEADADEAIATRVSMAAMLGEHKGINAPNVPLPAAGVTAKDEVDLRFGLALQASIWWRSASSRRPKTSRGPGRSSPTAGRPGAADHRQTRTARSDSAGLPEICAAADALMVARGDLGLEMPLEQVPQVQKQVLRIGRERGVPVIVATQVLESMRTRGASDTRRGVGRRRRRRCRRRRHHAVRRNGDRRIPGARRRGARRIIRNAEAVPPVWTLPVPSTERPDHLPALCDAAVTLAGRAGADAIRRHYARRPHGPIAGGPASAVADLRHDRQRGVRPASSACGGASSRWWTAWRAIQRHPRPRRGPAARHRPAARRPRRSPSSAPVQTSKAATAATRTSSSCVGCSARRNADSAVSQIHKGGRRFCRFRSDGSCAAEGARRPIGRRTVEMKPGMSGRHLPMPLISRRHVDCRNAAPCVAPRSLACASAESRNLSFAFDLRNL